MSETTPRLNCALIVNLNQETANDKRSVQEGIHLLANIAHQCELPISWALLPTLANSYKKELTNYCTEFNDDIVLALDTNHLEKVDLNRADQIVTSRNKLFTHISKEKDRLQKIFPDGHLHTASTTGTINHILVEALESTGFYALAGYHAGGKDIGCPFDFFYPSEERHNFANQPQRSVVGIPTTDCLVEMVLEGRCHEYLDRHLYNLNFGHQLNANSSLVFTADITRVANCVGSQLDLLTEFLARLSQKEIINIQPLGHLVNDFRTTNPTITPPTCFLDQSRLFYYDDNCHLIFDSSQTEPVEIYNYISPPIGSLDGKETEIPPIIDFKSSRSRLELRMSIEIESAKNMPFGFAIWGDHIGLKLMETDALSVTWIDRQLLLVRVDLCYGQNKFYIRLTI